jgi:hypothetical protein
MENKAAYTKLWQAFVICIFAALWQNMHMMR